MNRIDECFARLKTEKQKGFIAYIGAGDHDLAQKCAILMERYA